MKKYPFLIAFILLSMVVMASGCISDNNTNKTNTYSKNGISFQYNGTWEVSNTTISVPNAIVGVGDPKTVDAQTKYPSTFVLIQKANSTLGNDLSNAYTQNYAKFFNNTNNSHISEANITVNNNKAMENVYMTTSGGVQTEMRAVWMAQNGAIYVILCGALPSNFDKEQKNFDLVINSFKAQ